jgi:hypothetical protein
MNVQALHAHSSIDKVAVALLLLLALLLLALLLLLVLGSSGSAGTFARTTLAMVDPAWPLKRQARARAAFGMRTAPLGDHEKRGSPRTCIRACIQHKQAREEIDLERGKKKMGWQGARKQNQYTQPTKEPECVPVKIQHMQELECSTPSDHLQVHQASACVIEHGTQWVIRKEASSLGYPSGSAVIQELLKRFD